MTMHSIAAGSGRGLGRLWAVRLRAAINACLEAVAKRGAERAAIALLASMSEVELKDIGLTRSEITFVVKGLSVPARQAQS